MLDSTESSCFSSSSHPHRRRRNLQCPHQHLYLRSHEEDVSAVFSTATDDHEEEKEVLDAHDVERGLMENYLQPTATGTAATAASDGTETTFHNNHGQTTSSPALKPTTTGTNNQTTTTNNNKTTTTKKTRPPIPHERTHKATIFLVSLLVFAVCAGAGLSIFFVLKTSSDTAARNDALDLASEMGTWFSKELDLAILPLFSMAQFATELVPFVDLPTLMGDPHHDDHALPFLPNPPPMKRNVTGVCDQPDLVERYNQIAASVKTNSKMDGVLHNIQLSPQGVLCLAYPLNNTQDFDNASQYLDSTNAVGLDLLNEPTHMYIARQSMANGNVGVAGPMTLLQCPTCGLYFIVRKPIHSTTHDIYIDGEYYPRWGFATALISWDALVGRSQVHDRFVARGYAFQLTRTDHNFDEETQQYSTEVVVLAESEEFGGNRNQVSTALQTTNNEWIMTVQYQDGTIWVSVVAIAGLLVVSFFMAALVYIVLMQRQTHTVMRGITMTQEAKVELERHMTAYFAHELRNPLSAIDSALVILHDQYEQRKLLRQTIQQQQSGGNTTTTSASDIIIYSDQDDDETAELVAGMQLCSSFMSSIMDNLLDSRKLQENMMVLKNNPLSLATLMDDVHKMMTPAVRPGVELLVECNTTTTTSACSTTKGDYVFGDAHRLQQILTNVVSNAVKHTRTGSITLVAGWQGDLVRLECQDTGPGIPKEEQEDMFRKFTTRGGAPGTGLGLSIAKQIVDLTGGSIHFESDPTVKPGTNCVILLPLKPCEEPPSSSFHIIKGYSAIEQHPFSDSTPSTRTIATPTDTAKKAPNAAAATVAVTSRNVEVSKGGPATTAATASSTTAIATSTTSVQEPMLQEPLSILITDDIKMNRVMLKRRLQKCVAPNCTIVEAATGEESMEIYAQQSFDIVIMDQYMEQAGGLLLGTDVIIALRRSKSTSLIIGCSGNALDEQFRAAGADIVWKKPIPSNAEIIRQLRQFFRSDDGPAEEADC